jgi:hypothetical protein
MIIRGGENIYPKEIEELLLTEQKDGKALIDEKDAEINELRRRQAELMADYEELTKMKTTLEEEIHTYRRLLEGEGEKEGWKQVVEGIEERARQQMFNAPAGGFQGQTSYSFSISQQAGGGSRYTSGNTVASLAAGRSSGQASANAISKLKYSY